MKQSKRIQIETNLSNHLIYLYSVACESSWTKEKLEKSIGELFTLNEKLPKIIINNLYIVNRTLRRVMVTRDLEAVTELNGSYFSFNKKSKHFHYLLDTDMKIDKISPIHYYWIESGVKFA